MSNTPDTQYNSALLELLASFVAVIKNQPPFTNQYPSEDDVAFMDDLTRLASNPHEEDFLGEGQQLICKVVASYPHLMPVLPRDLLWFFGGDCLHYMPDEEIASFQMLDDRRHQATENGEDFSYPQERARVMGLH